MNIHEFKRAVEMAVEPRESPTNGYHHNMLDSFNGFGLRDFEPVTVTLAHVAELVRYHAMQFNGELNAEALDEIRKYGRQKFIVVPGLRGIHEPASPR